MRSYAGKNTVKIYLTATYAKSLHEWKIPVQCQMYWDIEDEQICKSIIIDESNISRLSDRHGDIMPVITSMIDLGYTMYDIFEPYGIMPELHVITNLFDAERYDIIKQKIMGTNYGFSFDALFGLSPDKTKFKHAADVKTMLCYISGSNKEVDYPRGDESIFARINAICTRHPYVQIWFLPSNNINNISKNLYSLMQEDFILRRYAVLCVNRISGELAKDIKEEINKHEIIAHAEGKRGLILLAGNMLSLGITINSCDVCVLMNNTFSQDKVMQQMYRCMTEGKNKSHGFVVDLNINRVLQTCITYNIKGDMTTENKIKYLIENHLINIDVDIMKNKKINADIIIAKLMDIWKGDPINNIKRLLRGLEDDYVIFDNPTQRLLNNAFIESVVGDTISTTIILKDETDEVQTLPFGVIVIKTIDSDSELSELCDDTEELAITPEEIKVSFAKDVLPYVIPLTCILTIESKNKDFVQMLTDIKDNIELLEIFDDQCMIWWRKKGLINFIKDLVAKYYNKNSNTYNISILFKMDLQSMLDRPKELLELIADCLKPKLVEKKTFGEVFTPMNFINDSMLHHLEKYYTDTYKSNIYENESYTWYDPAAGMGNYPIAIYYKLMHGLRDVIPNEAERKHHIITNQLYMGELNRKNCFIMRQIFGPDANIYEGDTLQDNIFSGVKFDIIIGNPPYNEEFTLAGAKPLYHKFINHHITKCTMLSFITPSRWFAGGKGLDKFRKMMMTRKDIVYLYHYANAGEIFGRTVSIEGGVSYFLIESGYKGLCRFNDTPVDLSLYDIILDSKYYSIVNKIITFDSLTNIYMGRYYGIESNDKRLCNNDKLVKCYVSQQKGFIKYIDHKYIKKDIIKWKVITARANGKNGCFGNMFIGSPNEVHTGSYISFAVSDINEANSLLSYLKCRLPNFMLSLRKISQDISESSCKWIPLPPLDRIWTDKNVYSYYKLTDIDIKLITDTKIIGYKDL